MHAPPARVAASQGVPIAHLAPALQCIQELTFEVGPSEQPKQLRAALYAVAPGEAPGSDEFIGSGRWVGRG